MKKAIIYVVFFCFLIIGVYFYAQKNYEYRIPIDYRPYINEVINTSGNSANIKSALWCVYGNELLGMCDMLLRMPPNDVSNLKTINFVKHIKTTYKTNKNVSWSLSTNSPIFLDFVLPHRIGNESYAMDRSKIKSKIYPVISYCKTPVEVVKTLRGFMMINSEENKRFFIGPTAPHDYTPLDGKYYGIVPVWNCRARNIFLVEALRSVGIPAMITEPCSSLGTHFQHTFFSFYDAKNNKWYMADVEAGEPINNEDLISRENDNGYTFIQSNPPYPFEDSHSKRSFYNLVDMRNNKSIGNVAVNTSENGTLSVGTLTINTENNNNNPVNVGIYVWFDDLNGWYPAQKFITDKSGKITFLIGVTKTKTKKFNSYMITVGLKDKIVCKYLDVNENKKYNLTFDLAKANSPF